MTGFLNGRSFPSMSRHGFILRQEKGRDSRQLRTLRRYQSSWGKSLPRTKKQAQTSRPRETLGQARRLFQTRAFDTLQREQQSA